MDNRLAISRIHECILEYMIILNILFDQSVMMKEKRRHMNRERILCFMDLVLTLITTFLQKEHVC